MICSSSLNTKSSPYISTGNLNLTHFDHITMQEMHVNMELKYTFSSTSHYITNTSLKQPSIPYPSLLSPISLFHPLTNTKKPLSCGYGTRTNSTVSQDKTKQNN